MKNVAPHVLCSLDQPEASCVFYHLGVFWFLRIYVSSCCAVFLSPPLTSYLFKASILVNLSSVT